MSRDTQPNLIDNEPSYGENADGLFIRHDQPITDAFLEDLKSERMAKAAMRSPLYNRVASVPTAVVELWLRQGVPFYQMTAHEVVQKLERDNLHAFIATPKRV